jgi:hypothetical protein
MEEKPFRFFVKSSSHNNGIIYYFHTFDEVLKLKGDEVAKYKEHNISFPEKEIIAKLKDGQFLLSFEGNCYIKNSFEEIMDVAKSLVRKHKLKLLEKNG